MENEILSEVWRNREEFAKRYNYDLDAMITSLKKMEVRLNNAADVKGQTMSAQETRLSGTGR